VWNAALAVWVGVLQARRGRSSVPALDILVLQTAKPICVIAPESGPV
jgi:hypothetical protein